MLFGILVSVGSKRCAHQLPMLGRIRANGDGGLDHSALLRGVERLSGRSGEGR